NLVSHRLSPLGFLCLVLLLELLAAGSGRKRRWRYAIYCKQRFLTAIAIIRKTMDEIQHAQAGLRTCPVAAPAPSRQLLQNCDRATGRSQAQRQHIAGCGLALYAPHFVRRGTIL